jgi:hypothetical protein
MTVIPAKLVPAKAGEPGVAARAPLAWVPALAGMTKANYSAANAAVIGDNSNP